MVLGLDESFSEPESALDLIEHITFALYFTTSVFLQIVPQVLKLLHAQSFVFLQNSNEDLSFLVVCSITFDPVLQEAINDRLENFVIFNLFLSNSLVFFCSLFFLFVAIKIVIKIIEIGVCKLLHSVLAHVTEWPNSNKPRLNICPDQR
jgi:hypothetical protein